MRSGMFYNKATLRDKIFMICTLLETKYLDFIKDTFTLIELLHISK